MVPGTAAPRMITAAPKSLFNGSALKELRNFRAPDSTKLLFDTEIQGV